MGVVGDVILTVTEIAITPGAVPEFQFRVGYIGSAANGTFVAEVRSFCRPVEWNRSGLGSSLLRLFGSSLGFPGLGDQIQNILAHKQEIVAKSNQGEQIVREIHHRVA